MNFKYPWRDYQSRVLLELNDHIDDRHLHVVAAPGSGKTVLGLEVMKRINKPTIIFAPTITIRNQWSERLQELFLDTNKQPSWVSKDIKKPKLVTITTYQALHAAMSGMEEELEGIAEEESESRVKTKKFNKVDVIKLLNEQFIQTIILDEAHHLRSEWWKALMLLKKGLVESKVVSLTATPPYDVDYSEWKRYEELCGPIDAEISVPELVFQGDLCPHQDYVYFSIPRKIESEAIEKFSSEVEELIATLKTSTGFIKVLETHKWIADTENNVENILKEPNFFSSILIFLNDSGNKPDRRLLRVLGANYSELPKLDAKWLEILLQGIIFKYRDDFKDDEEEISSLQKKLSQIGAIEKRKVEIEASKEIKRLLGSSLSKLDAITEITKSEYATLNKELKMVILTDFIRLSDLPKSKTKFDDINKIGVIPIFETLRRANLQGIKLGVLTGSLVIIPEAARPVFEDISKKMGLDKSDLKFIETLFSDNFFRLEIIGEDKNKVVHLVTEVFKNGGINVLVGTQSLLGEGWDAPSINTLVLASNVGSFMLSNQMRGRAIRKDPNQPNKVSNVWHLASVDPVTVKEWVKLYFTGRANRQIYFHPLDEIKIDLGYDVKKIVRRFRVFEGLSHNEPNRIENGFNRLGIDKFTNSSSAPNMYINSYVKNLTNSMINSSKKRELVANRWKTALLGKSAKPEITEKLQSTKTIRSFAFSDTIKYLIVNSLLGAAGIISHFMHSKAILIGIVIASLYSAPKLIKALWLLLRNGSVEGNIREIGNVVIETLHNMNIIKTNPRNLELVTANQIGIVFCKLKGGTSYEATQFLSAMQEILNPIDNPRYLIMRKGTLAFWRQIDFHAIPEVIAQHAKWVDFYTRRWNRYVGCAESIYTRSIEGRQVLLRARTKALSSGFRKKANKITVWE